MKKNLQTLIYTIVAIILFTACRNNSEVNTTTTAISSDSAKAMIAVKNAEFNNAIAKNDSTAFVNCYTDNLCFYPPNATEICNKDGVGKFFSGIQKMGVKGLLATTKDVFVSKDIITETGTYDLQIANNQSVDKGKYMVIWKQENGNWKMHRDIFNSDMPPPPPMPTK